MRTLTHKLEQVENALTAWRERAVYYKARAVAGQLTAFDGRTILDQAAWALDILSSVPHTAAAASKAAEEWDYQGNLADDFTAIETVLHAAGDWVAARDSVMWNGYARVATYPWAETAPTFTAASTAGLQAALDEIIAAIDVIQGNIA